MPRPTLLGRGTAGLGWRRAHHGRPSPKLGRSPPFLQQLTARTHGAGGRQAPAARNPWTPPVLGRRGPALSHARPADCNALWGRGTANPAGRIARIEARRRFLRAGRALHWPPLPRHFTACPGTAPAEGLGEHHLRGRARRGDHAKCRLLGRLGACGRRAWRQGDLRRASGRTL